MNPVNYLEKLGWYNEDKHIRAKKSGEQWKLTYMSNQRIGQDTINYLSSYLKTSFVVVTCRIKNATPHTIYYASMPKDKNYLTMYLVERPEVETYLYCAEDNNGKLIKIDVDRLTAEQIAHDNNGRVYYNLEVKYPSPSPSQYWLWKDN